MLFRLGKQFKHINVTTFLCDIGDHFQMLFLNSSFPLCCEDIMEIGVFRSIFHAILVSEKISNYELEKCTVSANSAKNSSDRNLQRCYNEALCGQKSAFSLFLKQLNCTLKGQFCLPFILKAMNCNLKGQFCLPNILNAINCNLKGQFCLPFILKAMNCNLKGQFCLPYILKAMYCNF